jgi:hypothetical protein
LSDSKKGIGHVSVVDSDQIWSESFAQRYGKYR